MLVQAIAADQGFGADTGWAFAVAREHLDHPAGVAAIQGGGRAAQDFDAVGGVEVEGGGLALAIRGAGGDAIGNQLDPAYAKRRTRAKTTGGNLQVLGIVLAVLHHQPRHAGQGFRGIDAQLAVADLLTADAVHRVGQVETAAGATRARHHTGVENQWGVFGQGSLLQAQQAGEQHRKTGGSNNFHERTNFHDAQRRRGKKGASLTILRGVSEEYSRKMPAYSSYAILG